MATALFRLHSFVVAGGGDWDQREMYTAAVTLMQSCKKLQSLVTEGGLWLKEVLSECVFVLPGPLAVPDAAAQGHGDPG